MSLLDGFPTSEEQLAGAFDIAKPTLVNLFGSAALPPRARSAVELMKAGMPMASLLGITGPEMDALFNQACRAMQFGEVAKARDSAIMLHLLKPLDSRYFYLLGMTYQVEADYEVAGKIYVCFLALDATNPEGYLRLGECFLANKEADMARESFRMAAKFAATGATPDQTRAYAEQMMAQSDTQMNTKTN